MIQRKTALKFGRVLVIVLAAVSLFFAQSAHWFNQTIFNQEKITSVVTSNVLSQASRDTIAASIVDRALEDKPLTQRVVGDRAESLISGLLESDLSTRAVQSLSDKTYSYVTTETREDIVFDLSSIKSVISALITVAQTQGSGERLALVESNIPNEIVLVESDSFPNLSGILVFMLWFEPLFWLMSIVLFGIFIYLGRKQYAKYVYIVGLSVVLVAIVGILTSPFLPSPIAASLQYIDFRPTVEGIIYDLLLPFRDQMYVLLASTVVSLGIFSQRFAIFRGIRRLGSGVRKQSESSPEK